MKEDIFLATPPPHPSESPIAILNPLSTAPQPTVAGTKLSLVAIKSKDAPSPVYHSPGMSQSKESQSGLDPRTSADTDSHSSLVKTGSGSNTSRNGDGVNVATEKFGGGNASLSASSKDAARRKKPKNNIAKNNSTFVSRIIPHETLAKRLAERNSEDLFVFANINRAFNWLDMGSSIKVQIYRCQQFMCKNEELNILYLCSKSLSRRFYSQKRTHFAMMSTFSLRALLT